jgi:xylulokinase
VLHGPLHGSSHRLLDDGGPCSSTREHDGLAVVVDVQQPGGGGRVPLVRRLLTDVLGRPVRWLPLRSASAIGAAVLAGRGIGVDVVPRMEPRPDGQPLT